MEKNNGCFFCLFFLSAEWNIFQCNNCNEEVVYSYWLCVSNNFHSVVSSFVILTMISVTKIIFPLFIWIQHNYLCTLYVKPEIGGSLAMATALWCAYSVTGNGKMIISERPVSELLSGVWFSVMLRKVVEVGVEWVWRRECMLYVVSQHKWVVL